MIAIDSLKDLRTLSKEEQESWIKEYNQKASEDHDELIESFDDLERILQNQLNTIELQLRALGI